MASIVNPLPRDRRHPADYRDDIEHAEVAAALSELPEDHPAAVAYSRGRCRTASPSPTYSQMVKWRTGAHGLCAAPDQPKPKGTAAIAAALQ
jgi:hypothetical protein